MDKEEKKEIVGMFEYISEKMDNRFDEMDNRFNNLETRVETGFQEVRSDIKGLRNDLDVVEQETDNNKGFSKEIDTLFEEVKNIKEHIGLKESC